MSDIVTILQPPPVISTNLQIGQGPSGPAGPTGSTGATGPTGPAGPTGTTDWNYLSNRPTNVSYFTNDANYVTSANLASTLSSYLTSASAAATYEPKITAGTASQYLRGDKSWATLDTAAVAENTNLYFTNARARGAISLANGAAAYNSSTGVLTVPTATSHLSNDSNFALTTGSLAQFAATTSAQLAGVVSDETGSGPLVFGTNATLSNPTINQFNLSGNISAPAWTTGGIRIKGVAATFTDTTSTGTVATAYTNHLGGNTIAASNAVTFTNYITTYIQEPVAGANVTFTNRWALGADSARFGTSNQLTISNAGVLSAISPVFSGSVLITKGSITTSTPFSITETWNAVGTTFSAFTINVTDTASASGSLLFDVQVGGASRMAIRKDATFLGPTTGDWSFTARAAGTDIIFNSSSAVDSMRIKTNGDVSITSQNLNIAGGGKGLTLGSAGTTLLHDGALNTVGFRNGTNSQRVNIYGTYTDSSNFRRLYISSTTAGAFTIGVEGLGTGAAGNTLTIGNALIVGAGSATAPGIQVGTGGTTGLYNASSAMLWAVSGQASGVFGGSYLGLKSDSRFAFSSTSDPLGTPDLAMGRKSASTAAIYTTFNGSTLGFLQAKLMTDTAYTAGTVTPTGYLQLYDSNGRLIESHVWCKGLIMIDLSQLSAEQLYGLAFATQQANAEIDAFNATVPEGSPTRERHTVQSYAEARFRDMIQSYWDACNQSGLNLVTDVWKSLPPQTQNALKSQLGVGNVIADEYLEQLPPTRNDV